MIPGPARSLLLLMEDALPGNDLCGFIEEDEGGGGGRLLRKTSESSSSSSSLGLSLE